MFCILNRFFHCLKFLKSVSGDLEGLSLWDIARETGLNNAQTVSHHFKQLEKYGYLRRSLSNPNEIEVLKDPIEDVFYVNVMGFAQCGNVAEFFSEGNLKERVCLSSKLFGIARPIDSFLVRAKGDSMTPEIAERDLVLFEKADDVDSGVVALVIDDGLPKIKRVFKKSASEYILDSTNKAHGSKVVRANNNFRILGIGRGVIRGI